jgi:enamine deaminase RidA (YjgF/YER057c/UK114 family)
LQWTLIYGLHFLNEISVKIIQPASLATTKGHYSPGILHEGLVYVSGQLPMKNQQPITGSVEVQALCCLENIRTILVAAGSDLGQVLTCSIFISDIDDWPAVDRIFAQVMGAHRPARIMVPVKVLHYGCALEMAVIAVAKAGAANEKNIFP